MNYAEHISQRASQNSIRVGKRWTDKMRKLTAHDYFSIACYFAVLGGTVFMFYGGLVGAIKPLIAEIL